MVASSPHRPGGRARRGGDGRDLLRDELSRELLAAPLIANLATLNPDGTIHLVAMWFRWDGEAILIPTHRRTRKARNLERNPSATVMIDDSRGGFDLRGITLAGKAELVPAPEALELNRSIHLRYVTDAGLSLEPVRRYLATDDVTIRIRPITVSSWNLRDADQGRALNANGEFRPLGGS
jgi:PPOX class probable F420-dependent enzyme